MSDFWKRKMRTLVETFDFDKDGFIFEEDYASMARNFAEKQNADPERKEKLIRVFVNVWRKYVKSAPPEKADRLTADIFIESIKQQRYEPGLIIALVGLMRGLLELLDVNKDGYLEPEEHKRLFDLLGVPEDRFNRSIAFDALDTDHDGLISFDEFVTGHFDFTFSNDESSPAKFFFGPLVD